jgi:GNAT superfamily N-acetyltransferase
MIYKVGGNSREKLYPIFKNMKDTMILSYLQGHMGAAWVDDIENPTVAQILVGVFVFYAGDPNAKAAEELLLNIPENILAIVNTDEWKNRIEIVHKGRIEKFQRYAFKKNYEYLKRDMMEEFLLKLSEDYELRKIDKSIALETSFQNLSEDFTSQYESIDDYINKGVGYCILHNGQVVCGASSYSVYNDGIEIEIDTHPDYRRKGLATVASAALILDCLDKGKYPNWDAANLNSVSLAEKLGYILEKPYDTYYINYER